MLHWLNLISNEDDFDFMVFALVNLNNDQTKHKINII